MAENSAPTSFDVWAFLKQHNLGSPMARYRDGQMLYAQGDPADSVFYVHQGTIKITVISKQGKEAIVAIRGPNEFCGEGALTGKPKRLATLIAISTCDGVWLQKETMSRLLDRDSEFADYFPNYLLARIARVEADLADQLCNSSEMRLARALLRLTKYGDDAGAEPLPVKVNQETLAALIGTTRGRVNMFMNKFRKMGMIDYNGILTVQTGLREYVLNEWPHLNLDEI